MSLCFTYIPPSIFVRASGRAMTASEESKKGHGGERRSRRHDESDVMRFRHFENRDRQKKNNKEKEKEKVAYINLTFRPHRPFGGSTVSIAHAQNVSSYANLFSAHPQCPHLLRATTGMFVTTEL